MFTVILQLWPNVLIMIGLVCVFMAVIWLYLEYFYHW